MEIEALYLFDKQKELIDIIPSDELTVNEQDWSLNGLIKASVSGVYTDSIEQAHFFGSRDIDDPNVFWQYKITKQVKEDGLFRFDGIFVLFDDLSGRGIIRDRRPQNATIVDVLTYILEDTGWQIGQVQSTHRGTSNYYYVSKSEAFWDFIEKWRVEFQPRMTFSGGRVTGKFIDIYDRLSDDYGKWYEYGDTLLTVMAEEMRESVFTAFVGRGKGEEVGEGFGRKIDFADVSWSVEDGAPVDKPIGQDYVEIPWATDLYGYEDGTPRMTILDFPDVEDKEELIQLTYERALTECRPKVQFKSNVLENGRADVGETVTILRPDMGIRYKTRIFNLKRDFLNKAIKTVQFGEQLVQNTAQRNKRLEKNIKKQEEQTVYWLEVLHQQLTDTFFNEDGYNYDLKAGNEYDLPGGYYSFDRPIDQNPTKLIYMGAGMLAIANSQNPDGTWNFRTWATGDGMTLDAVNAGTLKSGRIQDFAGNSLWDLDNGFFRMRNGEIELIDGVSGDLIKLDFSGLETMSPLNKINTKLKKGYIEFGDDSTQRVGGMATSELLFQNERYKGVGVFAEPNKFFSIGKKYLFSDAEYQILMRSAIHEPGIDILVPTRIHENLNMNNKEVHNTHAYYLGNGRGGLTDSDTNRPVLTGDQGVYLAFGTPDNWSQRLYVGDTVVRTFRQLDLNGNEIINQSDIRLKSNVTDWDAPALDEIDRLKFITFEWDKSNPANIGKPEGIQYGIVAQYAPFLQTKANDADSYLSVDIAKQVNLVSKAAQELNEERKKLEIELSNTQKELASLKALLHEKGLI